MKTTARPPMALKALYILQRGVGKRPSLMTIFGVCHKPVTACQEAAGKGVGRVKRDSRSPGW